MEHKFEQWNDRFLVYTLESFQDFNEQGQKMTDGYDLLCF